MAYGDSPQDAALKQAWYAFCDQLKTAGDRVFKDSNPATGLQRADGFRYLTQNLSQAFDLALETKDTKYPAIHAFCSPTRKLGSDNADCIYMQCWIDGESVYKISGKKTFVLDGHVADKLIVVTRTSGKKDSRDGLTLFLIDRKTKGVKVTRTKMADSRRKGFQVYSVPTRGGCQMPSDSQRRAVPSIAASAAAPAPMP